MDLYVERQCIEQIKAGNLKQFLLLFDANFGELYKYVVRRLGEGTITDEVVRLTFLDALGQAQNTPMDSGYIVWLYSLARPRVWDQIDRKGFGKQGIIAGEGMLNEDETQLLGQFEKMIGKLSLEEREILRLKFFEEVADGDVTTVLGLEDGTIGPKIYRVLKRAHFLLFGESDERQGVYFGELSGFISRTKTLEKIEVPEPLKLGIRADLSNRIDRKDFAIEAEVPQEKPKPFEEASGSNDPAKIFVQAVKEMREEEREAQRKEEEKFERSERMYDFIDRWKAALTMIPVIIFVVVAGILLFKFVDFEDGKNNIWQRFLAYFEREDELLERGAPTVCDIEIEFHGDFSDQEKRNVNQKVSDRLCDHFEVSSLKISRINEGKVFVDVDVPDWFLEYKFVKKAADWRIKQYARAANSDKKSGEV